MAVSDYNNTPVSNGTISGIDIAENCSPAGLNNALRQMMADIKDLYDVLPRTDNDFTINGTYTFADNEAAKFGAAGDLEIYHNGTATSIIRTKATDALQVRTDSFRLSTNDDAEVMVTAVKNGAFSAYYDNSKKIETTSAGVTVTGVATATSFVGGGITKVLLATRTASASATLDFTEFDNATYHTYEFYIENLIPGTDADNLWIRTSTDGGSNYDASAGNYDWAQQRAFSDASNANAGATANRIEVTGGVGNAANENGVNGLIILHGAALAAYTTITGQISYTTGGGGVSTVSIAGRRNAASDVPALRFLFSSGTLASGKIRMYGVK